MRSGIGRVLLPAAIVITVIVAAVRAYRRVPAKVVEVDRMLAELRADERA